jgi:hypothetical protein
MPSRGASGNCASQTMERDSATSLMVEHVMSYACHVCGSYILCGRQHRRPEWQQGGGRGGAPGCMQVRASLVMRRFSSNVLWSVLVLASGPLAWCVLDYTSCRWHRGPLCILHSFIVCGGVAVVVRQMWLYSSAVPGLFRFTHVCRPNLKTMRRQVTQFAGGNNIYIHTIRDVHS